MTLHAEAPKLNPRWRPMSYHPEQSRLAYSGARFKVVPAGRRTGKTEIAKRHTVLEALSGVEHTDARYALCAPTHLQAKRIFWNDLKALAPKQWLTGKSESELSLRFWNGAEVFCAGLDVPERIEGPPLDGIVLDEYGNMKEVVWTRHVRPMLSERGGWAWFIGVPEGRNHYYDLYCEARDGDNIEWDAFTWTTEEVLPLYLGTDAAAREIAQAKHDMDELSYSQEYLASFVTFEGKCYYPFDSKLHCAPGLRDRVYSPTEDLVCCFDFNVAPGTAVVCQEHEGTTCIIGEVYVPKNSNTPIVCRKIISDWGRHQGRVLCYGDATGGAKGTAKVRGSDWDLIRNELRSTFGDRLRFRVPNANPRERVRVNAVNSRLKTADGTVRTRIDPARAPHTVKDFEGVTLLEGGSGEIDKKYDSKLTHLTDGYGYYVVRRHPGVAVHAVSVTGVSL